MTWRLLAAPLALIWLTAPAFAVTCSDLMFEGASFTTCEVSPSAEELKLFLTDDTGGLYAGFDAIEAGADGASPQDLAFAMNAGMFHPDRSPVGLYIEDGAEIAPLITSDGPGNFGLLPNGVFCIREGAAEVIESLRYAAERPACRDATQSGPMLVIDGALHPKFLRRSDSMFIRNGVGSTADGSRVVFAISNEEVNFHLFARLFRDALKLPNALYFDGNISRLHAPALDRSDPGFAMGPIVGVIAPVDGAGTGG